MSEQVAASRSAGGSGAARRAIVRSLVVVGLVTCGIVTVQGLEAALHATFNKPPAPLRNPLPMMKKELGTPVKYEAAGPDAILPEAEVETLGTVDYLVRPYRSTGLGEVGKEFVSLNVNYYATGSSTPHVPEVCWAANGREEDAGARCFFNVAGVKRRDGSLVDLRMKMISFKPPAGEPTVEENSGKPMYTNVAYVFQVNGDYVASTQEVTSRFWKASYRYAYHSKIEVTPLDPGPLDPANKSGRKALTCTQDRAQKIVSDFMREALREVEECLPDPAILTKG